MLVRMSFAGERHAKHGAAVECVLDGEDGGTASMSSRNLHGILDRFRSAVHEQRFLGEMAGRELIQLLCQFHVRFIPGDGEAEVEKRVELSVHGCDDAWIAMSYVDGADASSEIDEAIAVNIFECRTFSVPDENGRRGVNTAWNRVSPALG